LIGWRNWVAKEREYAAYQNGLGDVRAPTNRFYSKLCLMIVGALLLRITLAFL
jgi:hypothetical protein